MNNIELLSTNEVVFSVVTSILELLKNPKVRVIDPHTFEIESIKLSIHDYLFEEPVRLPSITGTYSISYLTNTNKVKKITIIGFRFKDKFKTSEIESVFEDTFKSFMFEELNSKEVKTILNEVIFKINSIQGQ